jgi:hypothetical protein
MQAELREAAAAEGQDVDSYVTESAAKCMFDDGQRRELFGAEGMTLRIPASVAIHKALASEASGQGISLEELLRTTLVNVTKRNVFTITLPEEAVEQVFQAAGRVQATMEEVIVDAVTTQMEQPAATAPASGSAPAAAVPMRRETLHDEVLAGKCRKKGEHDGGEEIEVFGLVPDTSFEFLDLLQFVCQVMDEHRDYLAKVVSVELSPESQAGLLEALQYVNHWRYKCAEDGEPSEIFDCPLLPGLAGRRQLSQKAFMGWFCYLFARRDILSSVKKHFLSASAPRQSFIEWGEVLAIAERVMSHDETTKLGLPDNRAEVKAAELLRSGWRVKGKGEVAA